MNNIKLLRNQRNLSQKQLSQAINCSQSVLCYYENGKADPTASVLIRLARFFDESIDYIVGYENIDGIKTN